MRYTQLIRVSMMALLMMPMMVYAQALERIQRSGTFNIGFLPDQVPFSFKSKFQQAAGYSIELCQYVADAVKVKLGLSSPRVSYVPTSLGAGLGMLEEGQIDLLCGAVTDTLKRRRRVSFSIPIFNSGIGALVRKDAPPVLVRVLEGEEAHTGPIWRATVNRGLANHTYAVHAGTTGEDWVREQIQTRGVIITIVTVDKHREGVDMVAKKRADAYFAERATLQNYVSRKRHHDKLMVLERDFTYKPIALVIARGDEDFRLVVDTSLSKLYRSDEFADIYTRYFGEPGEMTRLLFKIYARD